VSKIRVLFLCICNIFLAAHQLYAFDGPLQVRNEFPLFLDIDGPHLESASTGTSFSANFSYSSVYLVRNSAVWSFGLDMEISELTLSFRKDILDFIELGVDIPVISFNSGFLDGLLKAYHNTFGFPDYGRSDRPENAFLYEVRKKGSLVVKGKNGRIGIGDIRFTVKKPLFKGDPAVSVRGDLEVPTGDPKAGFGSGGIDSGIAVLADKNLGKNFRSYFNLGIIFPGDLKGYEKIELGNFIYGGVALEAALWKHISLVGQVFSQTSPFPRTGVGPMDRAAVLLTLGGRYYSGDNNFELSFTEDPNTAGAPDFMLNFSFKRRF
jgi:hypothetical protein